MKDKKIIFVYSTKKNTQNTLKLLKTLQSTVKFDLIEIEKVKEEELTKYDIVGFASGIYYGRFAKKIINFILDSKLKNLNVILLSTAGGSSKIPHKKMKELLKAKNWNYISDFSTQAIDKFGPLKLFGGLNKDRPTKEEIDSAKKWINSI